MQNTTRILIAASLFMAFRALEPDTGSGTVQLGTMSSLICLADCDLSSEPEVEDSDLFFDRHSAAELPAHFHRCISSSECIAAAAADIDPLTCRPPPIAI